MAAVQVTGLPNTVKMPKLVFTLRVILKRVDVQKFWIKEIADMRNCDLKEAKIEFLTYEDAQKVASTLDNFLFHEGNASSHLMAKVISGSRKRRRSPSPYRERSSYRGEYSERRFRDRLRSRSPVYREASKLDMELELLRKQRMVIEEERRLLLERKKLELIKEYGPSATREFEHMERTGYKRKRPKREERPLLPRPSFKARLPPPAKSYAVPLFSGPCKVLIGELKPFIISKANLEERSLLERLLRMQIRKRIAIALTGKEFLPAEKILKLYREAHPTSSDEDMVTSVLKNLRLSHWPVNKGKKKEDKDSQNIDKNTMAPPQEIQKKTETDADTSKPITIDVKEESEKKPLKEEPKTEVADEPEVTEEEVPEQVPEIIEEESAKEIPENTTEKESGQVGNEKDDADAGDITVELTVNGPEDEWIENGIGWNDEEEEEEAGNPAEI